ncbi:conserved hypothetical protein [Vibrio phage 249E41-1]|nr:conserved hypothetical protein [Vibrio phage 249E41-1]
MNNVDKYYWIVDHPKLCSTYIAQASIELTPQMVNPVTKEIDLDSPSNNTEQNWWVEVSSANKDYNPNDPTDHPSCHDWNLDTGGTTAEEAIDKLYELVLKHYGDYDYE